MKRIRKFIYRLRTGWRVVFGRYKRNIIIPINTELVVSILKEQDTPIEFTFTGCKDYVALRVIKAIADTYDDDDMALEKAKFCAEAELWKKNKK